MIEIKTTIKTDDKNFIEYLNLDKEQTHCVKMMYFCINNNNLTGFRYFFDKWHVVTSSLYHNKYNNVGHRLNDELIEYAHNKCRDLFDLYYDETYD